MLKEELTGSDRATIQDALSDAEEYLRTALSTSSGATAGQLTLEAVIEDYGMPEEVAAAYKQIESNTTPSFTVRPARESQTTAPPQTAIKDQRPFFLRFFGIFARTGGLGGGTLPAVGSDNRHLLFHLGGDRVFVIRRAACTGDRPAHRRTISAIGKGTGTG